MMGSPVPAANASTQPRFHHLFDGDFCEDIERYTKGGFHPVHIGDVFANRYEVVHKLGFGGIATVWLCMDRRKQSWCAVKILAADCSAEQCPDLRTRKIFTTRGVSAKQAEEYGVILPKNDFWIRGPNGRHLCFVLPVLGMTLTDWRSFHHETDHELIKEVCYQIVESMAFIHSNGICHGDFRPSNILMKVNDLDHLDQEAMLDLLGAPTRSWLYTHTGDEIGPEAPEYVVGPAPLETLRDVGLVTNDIAVVDFGESYEPSKGTDSLGIPASYAAPEASFGGRLGFGTDLWTLACTFLGLYNASIFGGSNPMQRAHCYEVEIGPLPEDLRPGYRNAVFEYRRQLYHQGKLKTKPTLPALPERRPGAVLEPVSTGFVEIEMERMEVIAGTGYPNTLAAYLEEERTLYSSPSETSTGYEKVTYQMPREDVLVLNDLLRKILIYEVEERLSATDVLKHPWFRETTPRDRKRPVIPRVEVAEPTFWGFCRLLLTQPLAVYHSSWVFMGSCVK
ncbi:kinase-like domain-containing protein [Xylariomycetidae sp. FL0641]|nr:kinase-like domain-containing protein [Xylariomycetidae sp. FL0641]